MPGMQATSGGTIEHEVYMLEGIILIVIELKLYFKNFRDHLAQVILELDLIRVVAAQVFVVVRYGVSINYLDNRYLGTVASFSNPVFDLGIVGLPKWGKFSR
jgi:hypothetical protein